MDILLFVLSATCMIFYAVKVIGMFLNKSFDLGIPVLHLFGVSFGNCYISTPALAYQVYFWANYAGLFNQ